MKKAFRWIFALLLAITSLAPTAQAVNIGFIKVVIDTPANAPALVKIGDSLFVEKSSTKKNFKDELSVYTGTYDISAPDFIYQGQLFTAVDPIKNLKVTKGKTAKLDISYEAVGVAGSIGANKITSDSIDLSWSNPDGVEFQLRRTKGKKIPDSVTDGILIAKNGVSTKDSDVESGVTYRYSLFSKVGGKWQSPISIRAAAIDQDNAVAGYASNPETVFVPDTAEYTVSWSEGTMTISVPETFKKPVPSTPYVFAASDWLINGFIGRVKSISEDGTEISFTSAGLGDAFNFFKFSGETVGSSESTSENTCAVEDLGDSTASVFSGVAFNGTLDVTVIGKKVWPNEIRKGKANFAVNGDLDVALTSNIHTVSGIDCQTNSYLFAQTFSTLPVPLTFSYSGYSHVTAESAIEITNIETHTTANIDFSSSILPGEDASSEGSTTLEMEFPIDPTVVDNGNITINSQGQFGFGVGSPMYETENSAFVGGSLVPFNGNVDPMYAVLDPRFDQCQSVDGTMSSDPSVFPSALLGKLTKSDIDPIDSATSEETLEATYLPIDCENIELPPNQGTVWGQGITKFDDNITDNPDQWSHFNNFDSSLSAWILSTGNISQVAQTPNAEADGILGKPGDELLTLLSGQETFDAVRYTINLKPTGNYLHIKYALASEEYPEWVGQFNDVMAILVGGVNCALIPETETAVSINTINAGSFPWLYIDNQSENPDRLNVFDGMTVPLTCNAAVTPNQNVTVEIIIADAGDEHLDSAVALFDNGIWSDNFPTVD